MEENMKGGKCRKGKRNGLDEKYCVRVEERKTAHNSCTI